MLDQRRQALDPVAVVRVQHAVDVAQFGVVDVAADHALQPTLACLARHRGLEVADVAHRALHLQLQIFRQAPVRQPHARAQRVQVSVELQRELVQRVAEVREPLRTLNHAVEQVAVDHPEPAAVGGLVNPFIGDLDAAEVVLHVLARELVVIARHEDHARALAHLAQELLHDVVVRLRPVPGAAQLPAVDDVADEVERLAFHVPEEREQLAGLAAGCAEVQVGDPDRAHAQAAAGCVVRIVAFRRRRERQVHGGKIALHGTAWSVQQMTRA